MCTSHSSYTDLIARGNLLSFDFIIFVLGNYN